MTSRRDRRLRLAYSAGWRRPARTFPTNPYGLTRAELRREIRRLSARRWQTWEIRRRSGPRKDSEPIE